MGNHCNDCPYCGMCALCEGCKPGCPGRDYEKALNEWRERRAVYVEATTEPLKRALQGAEDDAALEFLQHNPPPPEPKRVR
jgi:hypothetical protein